MTNSKEAPIFIACIKDAQITNFYKCLKIDRVTFKNLRNRDVHKVLSKYLNL